MRVIDGARSEKIRRVAGETGWDPREQGLGKGEPSMGTQWVPRGGGGGMGTWESGLFPHKIR